MKKNCTMIHIAIFYVVLLRVSVCWGKIRKLCEKTIEYIKKICMEIFPTFGIIFFLPSLFTHFKVFSFSFLNTHFFLLFELDNYHLFYIHSYLLIISLYTSISSHEIFICYIHCVKELLAYILNYLVSLNVGFNWQNLQLYAE